MNTLLLWLDKFHIFFNKLWGQNILIDIMLIIIVPAFAYFTIDKIAVYLYLILSVLFKIKLEADYKETHISINKEVKNNV